MTYKIFYRENQVFAIDPKHLPSLWRYYNKNSWPKEILEHVASKAIQVIDNRDMRMCCAEITGGGGMTENTLYDLPPSFEVKIEPENCQCKKEGKDESYRTSHCDYSCASKTTATIVPIEKPEPEAVEEDQDALWKKAEEETVYFSREGIFVYLKSRFKITRIQKEGQ